MKLFFSLTFFFVFLNSFAQYNPLLEEDKKWQHRSLTHWDGLCGDYITGLSSDTVIGNQSYMQLLEPTLYQGVVYYLPTSVFLREDTVGKKVYKLWSGTEEMIYDFSVNPGDTLFAIDSTKTVDSVFYKNYKGINRKVFTFRDTAGNKVNNMWIEGIGDTINLVHPFADNSFVVCMTQLVCVENSATSFYSTSHPCYAATLSIESNKFEPLKVFPNPTSEVLSIINPGGREVTVELINSVGLFLLKEEVIGERVDIDVTRFKGGLYILLVDGGKNGVEKIRIVR